MGRKRGSQNDDNSSPLAVIKKARVAKAEIVASGDIHQSESTPQTSVRELPEMPSLVSPDTQTQEDTQHSKNIPQTSVVELLEMPSLGAGAGAPNIQTQEDTQHSERTPQTIVQELPSLGSGSGTSEILTQKAVSSFSKALYPKSTHNTCRKLFGPDDGSDSWPVKVPRARIEKDMLESPVKRRLLFGRYTANEIEIPDNVRKVYNIIRKRTGTIGGNGSHGPIYGELTMGSMQKMINLMKEHTEFDAKSRFIDVGSGIGKPNLHVSQDPGVDLSYGLEVEYDRWLLGLASLKGVLDAASAQDNADNAELPRERRLKHKCFFEHGDIRSTKTFDPFTHVYMFSIGFPPALWIDLAVKWNQSSTKYLICYHGPKDIIKKYNFQVELLAQATTSMHGSKEGHMGYIYRRQTATNSLTATNAVDCGNLVFADALQIVNQGLDSYKSLISRTLDQAISSGPSTRVGRRGDTEKINNSPLAATFTSILSTPTKKARTGVASDDTLHSKRNRQTRVPLRLVTP